jgi:hypothetical protein
MEPEGDQEIHENKDASEDEHEGDRLCCEQERYNKMPTMFKVLNSSWS